MLLTENDIGVEQIRGMLRLKQVEIQEKINSEQQKLSLVEFRLRMIELESLLNKQAESQPEIDSKALMPILEEDST